MTRFAGASEHCANKWHILQRPNSHTGTIGRQKLTPATSYKFCAQNRIARHSHTNVLFDTIGATVIDAVALTLAYNKYLH